MRFEASALWTCLGEELYLNCPGVLFTVLFLLQQSEAAVSIHRAPFRGPSSVRSPERRVEFPGSAVGSHQSLYPESCVYVDPISQIILPSLRLGVHNVRSLHLCLFYR